MGEFIFKNILIICVGNICRSPVAEKILQKKIPNYNIESAGLAALEGKPIDKIGAELLEKHGYSSNNHKARKVNTKMIQSADIVLTMEQSHQQVLVKDYPQASGKVMLLGKWLDGLEISDPYQKSFEAFSQVFSQIEDSCIAWIKILSDE